MQRVSAEHAFNHSLSLVWPREEEKKRKKNRSLLYEVKMTDYILTTDVPREEKVKTHIYETIKDETLQFAHQ